MRKLLFLLLFVFTSFVYAQNAPEFPVLKGEYLGQTPPGDTPVVFARGIISDNYQQHGAPAFSPDGKHVFWQTNQRPKSENEKWLNFPMTMRRTGDGWTTPEVSPYSQPVFSPDGKRLYFNGTEDGDGPCFIETQGNNWSEPKSLGLLARYPELKLAAFLSIASNGTLYFIARLEGLWANVGIYRSERVKGEYAKPEPLPRNINLPPFRNWTPFIAPDESYLLFCSTRGLPATDEGDLFISLHKPDGGWTDPVNLGKPFNTDQLERFPRVSPDGKYLFFTRDTPGYDEDVYWVSTSSIPVLNSRINPLEKKSK
jgi:hypothetical protein